MGRLMREKREKVENINAVERETLDFEKGQFFPLHSIFLFHRKMCPKK